MLYNISRRELLCGAAAFAGMLSGVVVGWLSDRCAEWKLVVPMQLLSAAMLLAIAGTATPLGFCICYALNSFALGGIMPAM